MVAFASRRPDMQLVLPGQEEEQIFAAGLQKRIERQVANDARFLPKSTNMGLPDHISTGMKYNFEEGSDIEESSSSSSNNTSNHNHTNSRSATFRRATPCFFVSHIPSTLPWYKEILGFHLRGKADSGRAELFRGAPGVNRGTEGVFLYLRKVNGEGPVPKGSLWIEVDNVDTLCQEMTNKIKHFAQDITDYFPPLHLGSAKIAAKPRNTAWGQREMTTVDDVGNTIVFYQVLN